MNMCIIAYCIITCLHSRDAVLGYIDQESEWGPSYAYQLCVGGFRVVTELDEMRI